MWHGRLICGFASRPALACEEKAHASFVGALGEIRDPAVRSLFEELRDEEVRHRELVGREMAKLPPADDDGVDPEDFTAEPTSQ